MKKAILIGAMALSLTAIAGPPGLGKAMANDNRTQMEKILTGIPGVHEAKFVQDVSLWVFMTDKPHKFDSLGSMICNGGKTKFGVDKGYSITFWNLNKKQIGKFRCYN